MRATVIRKKRNLEKSPSPVAPSRLQTLCVLRCIYVETKKTPHPGWSIGETAAGRSWVVSGSNGENTVNATGRTQAEAWARACDQAAAVGMLATPRPGEGDQ